MIFLRRVLKSFRKILKFKVKSFPKRKPAKSTQRRKPVKRVVPKKNKPQKSIHPSLKVKPTTKAAPTPSKVKKSISKKTAAAAVSHVEVGEVTHFFDRIQVCVIKIIRGEIRKGDHLILEGKNTQLRQKVVSMQIESQDVTLARRGQLIGLKVNKPVRPGDRVYKLK